MLTSGRSLIWLAAGIVACVNLSALGSLAQSYPVKPIRMLVGYVAGGGTDSVARMVAQKLSENLGQSVVVENRPGASTAIATERVATSAADGYTLLLMPTSTVVLSALRTKLPYDLERDLAPVSLAASGPFVLVIHPTVPARNVKELVTLARLQPGKLNYGSPGVGTANHLAAELFSSMAKVKIVHVPYKGGAEDVIATATGQIDLNFPSVAAALPLLKAGKLRLLAVTSAKRVSLMPSVPTLAEAGLPGYDYSVWYGVLTPAGVPNEIVAKLHAAIGKIVNTPEMKESLNRQGFEPQASTPEHFAALIHGAIAQNAKLIELTGLKAE